MFNTRETLHFLEVDNSIALPKKFTFPFNYQPHELSVLAAAEVQKYLENQTDFQHDFGLNNESSASALGKMLGVMVVKTKSNKVAYIAAFSGKITEKSTLDGFVPPVFNTLNPQGFYKIGEQKLNKLNLEIETLENSESILNLKEQIDKALLQSETEISEFKKANKLAKQQRDLKRKEALKELSKEQYIALENELKKQSAQAHFLLKDLKKNWKAKIEELKKELLILKEPIVKLKQQRASFSADLQQKLHESYNFLNAENTSKNLLAIFEKYGIVPPAGAGECAAPKLFQYAYLNNLEPIAMAEFWWGVSPNSEIRVHKQFYPACRSKCEPILGHMMQGLDVAENPVKNREDITLDILFEDEYLLAVNKPHEFLSVSGKEIKDSVQTRIQEYLKSNEALLVHRLDMSTSGVLLVAKNQGIYKNLQAQFLNRTVEKRYVAVLNGLLDENKGTVNLPLRVDLDNRPRQLVCYEHGKPSVTEFEVIDKTASTTRIYFYPSTGRTHQLRVHSAHKLGLNTPILGDDLYGTKQERLHLHAEKLVFKHPVTAEIIEVTCEAPF